MKNFVAHTLKNNAFLPISFIMYIYIYHLVYGTSGD